MNVQLLVVEDCPNETPAAVVLRQALDQAGLGTLLFTTRLVTSQQEAEELGFLGSPSILIDGEDPFADPGRVPGLACRLYRDDTGLSGVPPTASLCQALKQAADTSGCGTRTGSCRRIPHRSTQDPDSTSSQCAAAPPRQQQTL